MMDLKEDNDEQVFGKEKVPTYELGTVVGSVKDLAKKDPLHVPEKYVRSHEEMEMDKFMPHLSSAIPIIDFALLYEGHEEELSKLDIACQEWGCFKLVNHSIKKDLLQRVKDVAVEFFNLPIEEKKKSTMTTASDKVFGYGHDPVLSEDQVSQWSDSLLLIVSPNRYSNHSAWPKIPKEFKEIVEEYSSEFTRVAEEMVNYISMNLGIEKPGILERHEGGIVFYRVNYYPPCTMSEKVLGFVPHTDLSTITFIMSNTNVSGLEVKHEGCWVLMNPMSDALDVIVGDMIQIWSNGKYKSAEHRAVINKNKERISHVWTLTPSYEVEVEPLDKMVDEKNPKLYKKFRYDDYVKLAYKEMLTGKHTLKQ